MGCETVTYDAPASSDERQTADGGLIRWLVSGDSSAFTAYLARHKRELMGLAARAIWRFHIDKADLDAQAAVDLALGRLCVAREMGKLAAIEDEQALRRYLRVLLRRVVTNERDREYARSAADAARCALPAPANPARARRRQGSSASTPIWTRSSHRPPLPRSKPWPTKSLARCSRA